MNTTISQSDATTVNKTAFELNSNFLDETESKISKLNVQNMSVVSSSERNSNDGLETNRDEKTKKEKNFLGLLRKMMIWLKKI